MNCNMKRYSPGFIGLFLKNYLALFIFIPVILIPQNPAQNPKLSMHPSSSHFPLHNDFIHYRPWSRGDNTFANVRLSVCVCEDCYVGCKSCNMNTGGVRTDSRGAKVTFGVQLASWYNVIVPMPQCCTRTTLAYCTQCGRCVNVKMFPFCHGIWSKFKKLSSKEVN